MKIRRIIEGDLENGFLETLNQLSPIGDLSLAQWKIIFYEIMQNPLYNIFVVEEEGKIIGTATLLLERKFIHKGGFVGHIEDVVINKKYQGKGLGLKLISHIISVAKTSNCYKVILNCSEGNISFYEKLGFIKNEICMRLDSL